MKKLGFLVMFLCMTATSAVAGSLFTSIEERTSHLKEQLAGNNSYHANLAREFAKIADEEKSQHDIDVARYFMNMAEEHAKLAGGK